MGNNESMAQGMSIRYPCAGINVTIIVASDVLDSPPKPQVSYCHVMIMRLSHDQHSFVYRTYTCTIYGIHNFKVSFLER